MLAAFAEEAINKESPTKMNAERKSVMVPAFDAHSCDGDARPPVSLDREATQN